MESVATVSQPHELPLDEAFAALELQMQALREAVTMNEVVSSAEWSPLPDTEAGLRQIAEFRQNLMKLATDAHRTSVSSHKSASSSAKSQSPSRVTFAVGSPAPADALLKAAGVDGTSTPVSVQYASSASNPGGGIDRAGMLQLVGVSDAVAKLVSRHAESTAVLPSTQHTTGSDGIRSALRSISTPRTLAHTYPALFSAGSEPVSRPSPLVTSAAIEGFDSFVRTAKPSPGSETSTPLSPSSSAVTPRLLKSLASKPLPEWARSPVARYSRMRGSEDAKTLLEGMRIPDVSSSTTTSHVLQSDTTDTTGSGLGPFSGVTDAGKVTTKGSRGPTGYSQGESGEHEEDDTGPLSATQKYLLLRTLKPKPSEEGVGKANVESEQHTPAGWTGPPSNAHLLRSFQAAVNTSTDASQAPVVAPAPAPVPQPPSPASSRGSPEPEVVPIVIPKMRSTTMAPVVVPTEAPHVRKGPSAATAGHKPMPVVAPPRHSPMDEDDDSDISTPALRLSAPRVEEYEDEFVKMLDDRWKQLNEDD